MGTSISNINNTGSINYGVSVSNTDAKVGKLLGITTPNFLQRNEIVLPSTFTNSSLVSVGTLEDYKLVLLGLVLITVRLNH